MEKCVECWNAINQSARHASCFLFRLNWTILLKFLGGTDGNRNTECVYWLVDSQPRTNTYILPKSKWPLWGSDISALNCIVVSLFAKQVSGFIDLVACLSINKWMARIDHDQITESIMQLHTHGTNWYASLLNWCALMRIQRTDMQQQSIDSIANKKNAFNKYE